MTSTPTPEPTMPERTPAQLATDLVCHEEQMIIWSGEVTGRLSIGGYFREDWSYEDTINVNDLVAHEIREIVECAFGHPELSAAPPLAPIPPGYALVPIDPSEEMIAAGWIDKEDVNPDDIYRAMLAAAPAAQAGQGGWQPIETAPKDTPILAWCDHEVDPWEGDTPGTLTLYAAHAEGFGHAPTGFHIVEWGGGFDDRSHEPPGGHLPDFWFVAGSDFDLAANPVRWWPLPSTPRPGAEREA